MHSELNHVSVGKHCITKYQHLRAKKISRLLKIYFVRLKPDLGERGQEAAVAHEISDVVADFLLLHSLFQKLTAHSTLDGETPPLRKGLCNDLVVPRHGTLRLWPRCPGGVRRESPGQGAREVDAIAVAVDVGG